MARRRESLPIVDDLLRFLPKYTPARPSDLHSRSRVGSKDSICRFGSTFHARLRPSAATRSSQRTFDVNHSSIFKNFHFVVGIWADIKVKLTKTKNHTTPTCDIKVVYFIRHGEGVHNEIEKAYGDEWWDTEESRSEKYLDTGLTEIGINDARSKGPAPLAAERANGMPTIERIIVSTLSRTIQTAQNFFEGYPVVSPQFVSMELCRERLGMHTPNKRTTLTKLKTKFPTVDFAFKGAEILDEEDVLWDPNHMETDPEIQVRAVQFLEQFFDVIPDTHVAVVAHYKLIWGMWVAMRPQDTEVTPDNCEVVPIVLERVH
ncbi:Phosphoglycerate mutase family, partial [Globisporangium splendens]